MKDFNVNPKHRQNHDEDAKDYEDEKAAVEPRATDGEVNFCLQNCCKNAS